MFIAIPETACRSGDLCSSPHYIDSKTLRGMTTIGLLVADSRPQLRLFSSKMALRMTTTLNKDLNLGSCFDLAPKHGVLIVTIWQHLPQRCKRKF
jgi:hypothetical protein